MFVIKKIARWILFLDSSCFLFFFKTLNSESNESLQSYEVWTIFIMATLSVDMFLLLLGVRLKRWYLRLEVCLYITYIIMFVSPAIFSHAITSPMTNGLKVLGESTRMLLMFMGVAGLMVGSVCVVLIDAVNQFKTLSAVHKVKGG